MGSAQKSGVGIEDLARALASEAGQTAEFDDGRDSNNLGVGPYAHHIIRAVGLRARPASSPSHLAISGRTAAAISSSTATRADAITAQS
jgi:hypothetical protein